MNNFALAIQELYAILNAAFDDNISDALFRRMIQVAVKTSAKEASNNA